MIADLGSSSGRKDVSASDPAEYRLQWNAAATLLTLRLQGSWRLNHSLPTLDDATPELERHPEQVTVNGSQIEDWDSSLLLFLGRLSRSCREREIPLCCREMPSGVDRLLELAQVHPEKEGSACVVHQYDFLSRVGYGATEVVYGFGDLLAFIGEITRAVGRILGRQSRFRWREMGQLLVACGAEALPIVSLIAFLVGMILAFVSTVQLEIFGASIYVANLVGLGMARDMGAMMAAIIMAGRTGAAYAAQIGTMQVNEEVDALRTLGISPMEFLVLPRLLAMTAMMPLLCIYADFMGILGGAVTTAGISEITFTQYLNQTTEAVPLKHFVAGLIKSGVYGLLVAMAGCLHGMRCGRSAQSVGLAATAAVVAGIIWIVVACAIITVLYYVLGI